MSEADTPDTNSTAPLYECAEPGCEWRNPAWRYGFAEAGATWAYHVADHEAEVTEDGDL